jgi:hypothetical protein
MPPRRTVIVDREHWTEIKPGIYERMAREEPLFMEHVKKVNAELDKVQAEKSGK